MIHSLAQNKARNKHIFKAKVVLEAGWGLDLLSLFTVKAGAKRVLGNEPPRPEEQQKSVLWL